MSHNPIPGNNRPISVNPRSGVQNTVHGTHHDHDDSPAQEALNDGSPAAAAQQHDTDSSDPKGYGKDVPLVSDDRFGVAVAAAIAVGVLVAAWYLHKDEEPED